MENNKIEDNSLTKWCHPGVFRIRCLPTNRAYFDVALYEIFFELREFFEYMEIGKCDNIELLNDFKKYGRENFNGYIVVASPEYRNRTKLQKALEECKASWPGELY